MDGVVDQIVQQERERRRLEEEAKKRQDAAYNVVMALPVDEQPAVVVRLLDAFAARGQREPAPKAAQSAPKAEPSTNGAARRETFVDKAEAFVLAHPEGVKTRQVADAIGQDVSAVDTTLRQVMEFYVERDTRPDKWYSRKADGTVRKFDDLPLQYHPNVNIEPPFDRHIGDQPIVRHRQNAVVVHFKPG